MKEMQNLVIKNQYFDKIVCKFLTQEQKDKALPLLMFMIIKRNRIIKTREVVNGKHQKLHVESDFSSPTPTFIL